MHKQNNMHIASPMATRICSSPQTEGERETYTQTFEYITTARNGLHQRLAHIQGGREGDITQYLLIQKKTAWIRSCHLRDIEKNKYITYTRQGSRCRRVHDESVGSDKTRHSRVHPQWTNLKHTHTHTHDLGTIDTLSQEYLYVSCPFYVATDNEQRNPKSMTYLQAR